MALTTRNTRETAPKAKSALALCECIHSSRLALGLTQAQVAGFSALSERFLGELENGRTSVSLSRVRTLATLLNIQILVRGKFIFLRTTSPQHILLKPPAITRLCSAKFT